MTSTDGSGWTCNEGKLESRDESRWSRKSRIYEPRSMKTGTRGADYEPYINIRFKYANLMLWDRKDAVIVNLKFRRNGIGNISDWEGCRIRSWR